MFPEVEVRWSLPFSKRKGEGQSIYDKQILFTFFRNSAWNLNGSRIGSTYRTRTEICTIRICTVRDMTARQRRLVSIEIN